jgi:hypothetical protein
MQHSIEVTLEVETDDDVTEVELTLNFSVQPAEPDVGIMSDFINDYAYTMPDGRTPDPTLKLDEIDERTSALGVYPAMYKNPGLQRWHERNLEDALESLDCDLDYTY